MEKSRDGSFSESAACRRRRTTSAALATLLALGAGVATVRRAAAAGHEPGWPRAHAAHTLRATDYARLHYVSADGSLLFEEGRATGALPGAMKVHMRVEAQFSGSFKIYVHGGTIGGHGVATPHGSGRYESFAGSLTVARGSGRYAHARGRARLYGTFDRDTYALVVQTQGTLYY